MDKGSHLVIFHIGPVQTFISTARSSQDLWFGSWLLSELAKAAALQIINSNNNDVNNLVFPSPQKIDDLRNPLFNVSNRVVTIIKGEPEKLAEEVKKVVLEKLVSLAEDAFSDIEGEFDKETALKQLKDLLEFFWAAYPLNDEKDYAKVRAYVDSILNARKVTRNFSPVTWGCNKPKCSLCGIRESVIPEEAFNMCENDLYKRYGVKKGERLCGVGLLKRHGKRIQGERFYSTSHVAVLPLLQRLNQSHVQLVDGYIDELKKYGLDEKQLVKVASTHPVFKYDGELLFEERLRDFFPEKSRLEKAQNALRNFLEKAFDRDKPYHYYVLLQADGDNMGKVIDGQESIQTHRRLSQTQSMFAKEAKKIIESHHGSLVYSGGDDVLAFLPLHTALACAKTLAENFRNSLSSFKTNGQL